MRAELNFVKDVTPEIRRVVRDLLTEGIASTEIPDSQLRAKVKHILET